MSTTQAYSDAEYAELLLGAGFARVEHRADPLGGTGGPLYANLLALGCIWAGRLRRSSMSGAGSVFAWLAWVLLLLDLPENVAYLNLVGGESSQPWPLISGTCVLVRTALVIAALGFMAQCLKQSKAERAAQQGHEADVE